MSSRSDVGLAIKTEAFEALTPETQQFLDEFFETKLSEDDEGRLFHASDVKWYDIQNDIRRLYDELLKLNENDFLILEGCHEYPDSEEGCHGDWYDNPWGLTRNVSVSVEFCE